MARAMTGLNTGASRHALKDRKDDLYEAPPEAVYALLRVERVPSVIWEACCGPGAIARILRASGRQVIATDLVDYQSPDQDFARRDFLMERIAPHGVQAIVTNPPFKLAEQFVDHALRLCPRVILLLRFLFYEAQRKKYRAVLEDGRLARIHVFANRVPEMHRAGWDGPKSGSAIAFAWFVWDARRHHGNPKISRIWWTPSRNAAGGGCYGCGGPMPAGRSDRQWCSNACRQRAYRHRSGRP
jgi:hypothetical protein